MRYGGDIPAEHRKLIAELEALELWFQEHGEEVPLLTAAKGFVCIAHDYYAIGLEEEGERFLRKTEAICPLYFMGPVYSQAGKDADYAYLVAALLKDECASPVLESLGLGHE